MERLRPLQRALDSVERWSKNWGIPLSKTKSGEAVLFWSNHERKDTNQLELYLGGERLKFVQETKLLGVTIDDRLTFNTHLAELRAKTKRRMKAIAATTGKTWGEKTTTIRTAYMARVRSVLSHGAVNQRPQKRAIRTSAVLSRKDDNGMLDANEYHGRPTRSQSAADGCPL